MSSDWSCPVCESHRCDAQGCNGRPGYVYVPRGQGWYPYVFAAQLERNGHEVHWGDVWSYSKYGLTPEKDRIVVLDTETTGLHREHQMIEVAWAEPGRAISSAVVEHGTHTADPFALEINRYNERKFDDPSTWAPAHHMLEDILTATFEGATVMGSQVDFDRGFLSRWLADRFYSPPAWHHRPLEIGSYVAGRFGIRRSLSAREIVGVMRNRGYHSVVDQDHTAAGDVESVCSVWLALGDW